MEQNLIYSIDGHTINKNILAVSGWVFDIRGGEIDFAILENGKKIDHQIKFVQRLDVLQFHSEYTIDRNCGFNITFEYIKSNNYILSMSSNGESLNVALNINKLKLKHLVNRLDLKEAYKQVKRDGVKPFMLRMSQFFMSNQEVYQQYFNAQLYSKEELSLQSETKFDYCPMVSIIVPAYKTPENFLIEMIDSVRNQTYKNWQLCIADGSVDCEHMDRILKQYMDQDKRIKCEKLSDNYGISGNTNKALELADGDIIALLDHDDLLAPEALFEIVKKFNEDKNIDVVYTDEDKISMEGDKHFDPAHKPDFNLELLRSSNYICHFFAAKKEIIDEVGGFRSDYDGSQDFDFIFRCCEKARKVGHIDRVVYYWRAHINSTAENPESKLYCYESGKKAVQSHLERMNIDAESYRKDNYGMYGVNYKLVGSPLVTLIAYNAVKEHSLNCHYQNLKIVYIKGEDTKTIDDQIRLADSDFVAIMDSRFKFDSEECIDQLVARLQLGDTGAMGVKVLNNSKEYISCGRVVGVSNFAKSTLLGESNASFGYMGKAICQQEISALPVEFVIFKKEAYLNVGGLDSTFSLSSSIVDICLGIWKLNQKVILDARYAIISKVQFTIDKPLSSDIKKLRTKWGTIKDPYYNKNFSSEILYRFDNKK